MNDGKYKKDFLKTFYEINNNVNGHPPYRRRDNVRTITKYIKGTVVDIYNRYVIPYNSFILL